MMKRILALFIALLIFIPAQAADVARGSRGEPVINIGLETAKGSVIGHKRISKFGYNADIDTAAEEDVWTAGGTYTFPSDSGESIEAVSTSVADTLELTVEGLDANFDEQSILVTLTGTTPVAVSGTWTRINRAFNSNGTLYVGVITVENTANTLVYAEVPIADQQTNMMIWTVPRGFSAFIIDFAATMNKTGGASANAIFRLRMRQFGKIFRTAVRFGLLKGGASILAIPVSAPGLIPEKTDIKMSVSVDANDTDVSARLGIIYIENRLLDM